MLDIGLARYVNHKKGWLLLVVKVTEKERITIARYWKYVRDKLIANDSSTMENQYMLLVVNDILDIIDDEMEEYKNIPVMIQFLKGIFEKLSDDGDNLQIKVIISGTILMLEKHL